MNTTFPRLMLDHAARRPMATALREKEYGIWQSLSWQALAEMVKDLACGLHLAGLQRGEHVIVVGANRPRLYASMLAVQSLGAIAVPLYQDAVATEYVFPINNADVRFAVVENQEQVDKLLEIRPDCAGLAHIYFDDPRGLRNYQQAGLLSLADVQKQGQQFAQQSPAFFDKQVASNQADDVAAMRGVNIHHLF
jgi:long-chain acyl-CoA synthetase